MKKKNERNAGAKPKYKKGIETVTIHALVPEKVKSKCLEAIDKIVEPFKNK